MKVQFANKEFNLFNGEYRRYTEGSDVQNSEYLCVGVYGKIKVLFQYIDTTSEDVDFVQCIVNNIPEFALDYLVDILNTNTNMLIRLSFIPTMPTSFEIYYDYDNESNDVDDIIKWMYENNDFAAMEYRYTEVVNGHQKCVGE